MARILRRKLKEKPQVPVSQPASSEVIAPEVRRVKDIMREVSKIINIDDAKFQALVEKHKIVGDAKGKDMEVDVDAPEDGGEGGEAGDGGE